MSDQDVKRETTASIIVEWLMERRANCERLASVKTGEDHEGWLDDAARFAAEVKIVADYDTMKTRLEAERDTLQAQLTKANRLLIEAVIDNPLMDTKETADWQDHVYAHLNPPKGDE